MQTLTLQNDFGRELTMDELGTVSGGWNWGTGAFIGGSLGTLAGVPLGGYPGALTGIAGGAIGSIFDNIDYHQLGESRKADVANMINAGSIPAD